MRTRPATRIQAQLLALSAAAILAAAGCTEYEDDPDRVQATPEPARTQPGDNWGTNRSTAGVARGAAERLQDRIADQQQRVIDEADN